MPSLVKNKREKKQILLSFNGCMISWLLFKAPSTKIQNELRLCLIF